MAEAEVNLRVTSTLVQAAHPMTVDSLGAARAATCVPYWLYELAAFGPALIEEQAMFLVAVMAAAAGEPVQLALTSYTSDENRAGCRVLRERTFSRGTLFTRRFRRVVALSCESAPALARALGDAWSSAGNQTVLVTADRASEVALFLGSEFVDDAEANPVNEEGLLTTCRAVLSRGWDGVNARIFSREIMADGLAAILTNAANDHLPGTRVEWLSASGSAYRPGEPG